MPYEAAKDPYSEFKGASITGAARKIEVVAPADAGPAGYYWKQLWAFVPADVAGGFATINVIGVDNLDAEITPLYVPPGLWPLPAAQVRAVMQAGTTAGITVYGLRDK